MNTPINNLSSSSNGPAHADTATINEMIEVLNDGIAFYEEAAQEVVRPDLKALFSRMVATKKRIAQDLAATIKSAGNTPAKSGTFAGSLRKLYAEMRTKMTSDKNHEYVAQLEEFEDRILHTFEAAAKESDDAAVQRIAATYMSSVKQDHDLMRDLKKAN